MEPTRRESTPPDPSTARPAETPLHRPTEDGAADPAPARRPAEAATAAKADLLKRFLARFIDGLVAAVPYVFIVAIVPGYLVDDLLAAIAAAAYILVCDGLEVDFMHRRSLGKRLLNLRPLPLDNRPMDIEKSVTRNWMFAVGYFGVLPFIGWLISLAGLALVVYEIYKVLTDAEGRRWGDELAQTKVVEASA